MTNSESPAPNSYSLEETASGPAYSFTAGSRDVSSSGKLFISRAHSEREGIGNASPGPMYTWNSEVTQKRSSRPTLCMWHLAWHAYLLDPPMILYMQAQANLDT